MTTIDFDKWAELAKSNPEAFEALRSQFLNNILSQIAEPKRHKFECLQWRIDQIRFTTKTPLSACIKISNLMWSSFDELHSKYYTDNSKITEPTMPKKTATILQFQPQD